MNPFFTREHLSASLEWEQLENENRLIKKRARETYISQKHERIFSHCFFMVKHVYNRILVLFPKRNDLVLLPLIILVQLELVVQQL